MALQKAQTPDMSERGRSICEISLNMQIPPVRVLQCVAYKAIMAKLQLTLPRFPLLIVRWGRRETASARVLFRLSRARRNA